MIDENTLNRCLDYLAELNARVNANDLKQYILEMGYIVKQELELVERWNQQFGNNNPNQIPNMDIKKLIEDNTQLFNENKKLLEVNMQLKKAIDERLISIEKKINNVNQSISTFSDMVNKV